MQSLLAVLLVTTAVPEGHNPSQHQVVLYKWAVKQGLLLYQQSNKKHKGKTCHFLFQISQKWKKPQTRLKYLGKLLKLHSELWQPHNAPPYPQTQPYDKVKLLTTFSKRKPV